MGKSPAPILTARSLAIVGATERSHWPTNIFANLKKSGFPGPVWPVNPRRDEVWGEKCYPDIEALPEAPELALMIIPAAAVEDVLAKSAAMGVKSAIVYASGIGEGTDPKVIARGESLKAMIAARDIAVCGPNCMGLAAIRERLYLYPHTHISDMAPGPVGLVFQSGGTLSYFVSTATGRGLRFSYTISSGNELDLDLSDWRTRIPIPSCCSSKASASPRPSWRRRGGRWPRASRSSPSRPAGPQAGARRHCPTAVRYRAITRSMRQCASVTASSTAVRWTT
jgi:acyl-CoA synthetase (NDP forming)